LKNATQRFFWTFASLLEGAWTARVYVKDLLHRRKAKPFSSEPLSVIPQGLPAPSFFNAQVVMVKEVLRQPYMSKNSEAFNFGRRAKNK
jgi:hypothetical protein